MSIIPKPSSIRVVLDNLSTHSAGALYEAFPPAEARRILRRLEFHYTPKHASWLNMVEIEIGVLRGQCLDRRIDDRQAPRPRNRRLGTTAQCRRRPHQMDVHHRKRPRQNGAAPIPTPPKSHNHCAEGTSRGQRRGHRERRGEAGGYGGASGRARAVPEVALRGEERKPDGRWTKVTTP